MDIRFLHYLRYRSFGLLQDHFIIILISLIYQNWLLFTFFVFGTITFIHHTHMIYQKEDKGFNHHSFLMRLKEVEKHIDDNQIVMINLLKDINLKLKN